MFLRRKKRKTRTFIQWVIFIFCSFSTFSSRPQAKLILTHETFGVFTFHSLPISIRYMLVISDFIFRKSAMQYVCFQFLQVTVCGIQGPKCFTWKHILLLKPISFDKIQPPKPGLRHTANYVIHIQELHQLLYHRRFLLLLSILYPLFNTSQRNVNSTVYVRSLSARI